MIGDETIAEDPQTLVAFLTGKGIRLSDLIR